MFKSIKHHAIVTLALSLFTSITVAKTIERTFDVKKSGLLTLDTSSGAIRIDSHDNATVLVRVKIKGKGEDQMKVKFDTFGGNVTIKGEQKKNVADGFWSSGSDITVTYYITVPENYNLDLDTSSGSINISGLKGTVNAHTSFGKITLDKLTGTINANTQSGRVRANISKQPLGNCKLTTSAGSISVSLAQGIEVDLVAQSTGWVRSEFDIKTDASQKSATGKINGGGPKV